MATQESDVTDVVYDVSGTELVSVLAPILCANVSFVKALANNPAFVQALLANKTFCAAIGKKAGAVAGPAVTQGLGR